MESKPHRITTGAGQKLTFVSYEKAKEFWDHMLMLTSLKKTRNYLKNGHYYLFPAENVRDSKDNDESIGISTNYANYEVPSVITIGNIEYKTVSTVGEANLFTPGIPRYSFIQTISHFQVSYYSIGIYGDQPTENDWDAIAGTETVDYQTLWKGFFGYVESDFWDNYITPIDGPDSNRVGPFQYMYSAEEIDDSIPELVTIDGIDYNTEDLTDNGKAQLASLQFLEVQMGKIKSEIAVYKTARGAYTSALKSELEGANE